MGIEVPKSITGVFRGVSDDVSRRLYVRARADAFDAEFARRGYSNTKATRAVPAFVAISCLITSCGREEYNYNPAALPWLQNLQGPLPGNYYVVRTSDGRSKRFRSYSSILVGARDFVGNMLASGYRDATESLMDTGDAQWWFSLIADLGYMSTSASTADSYARVLQMLAKPDSGLDDAERAVLAAHPVRFSQPATSTTSTTRTSSPSPATSRTTTHSAPTIDSLSLGQIQSDDRMSTIAAVGIGMAAGSAATLIVSSMMRRR